MTQLRPLLPLMVALLFPLGGCEMLKPMTAPGAQSPGKVVSATAAPSTGVMAAPAAAATSAAAAPAAAAGPTPAPATSATMLGAAAVAAAPPAVPAASAVMVPSATATTESTPAPAAPAATAAAEPAPAAAAPAEAAPAPAAPAAPAPAAPAAAAPAAPAPAASTAAAVPADDMLDAVLWMQQSVEYEGATTTAFTLAKLRLDQALKDKKWTALPDAEKENVAKLPLAVICDVDETLLDNSAYQAWNITAGTPFSNETWGKFVESRTSKAVPGAVDFTKYAVSKNVKVFYVSNRLEEGEQATRDNMQKLGFPMGAGNVDTFLMLGEKESWTSRKSSRFDFIAKNYRVLLLLGDNFGDFTDAYKGSADDRQKVYDENLKHWGHDWIVLPNPSYGSFEAVPYQFNYQASPEEMRTAKRGALDSWSGQ